MARPVDEKIVKMSLDNRDFKSKAADTVGIFGKLSQAFNKVRDTNFNKSTQSLEGLKSTADRTTLDKLIEGASTVTSRFSTLGIIAITALQNITNRAVNAGITMAKAFTIDPIKDGFGEYELKMKSIQTIMSNTQGKSTLEDVTKVLDTLNTYADKTIYNFADMTSNIGTFTAAGVDLDKSAIAIQGIANLAAASGSNTQQASTAMYQLSQALASGSVKLQDWNSVVNAGMGGKLFQNALIKTADNMGIANTASENFRESLQEGWLTTDVLIATLNEFAEDESMLEAATKVRTFTQLVDTAKEAVGSGWAQTWEIIVGDFEEAGKMWSAVNDVISGPIEASAEARNKLLQDFVDLGGKTQIIDSIKNTFQALTKVISTVQSAFREVFPAVTARNLMDIANSIKIFTQNLKMSDETASQVKTIFQGLFTILKMGINVVKMVARALGQMIPDGVGGKVLNLLTRFAEMIITFDETFSKSKLITSSFDNINISANKVADGIGKVIEFIRNLFTNSYNTMKGIVDALTPFVTTIVEGMKEVLGTFTTNDLIGGGIIGVLLLLTKKFSGIGDAITGFIENIADALENASSSFGIFEDLGNALQTFTTSVKAASILAIAGAVGILALSLKLIATIDGQDISKSLFTLAAVMTMLTTSLKSISANKGSLSNTIQAVAVMNALATAVVTLSIGLKIIATMDLAELGRGMLGLAGIVTILVVAIKQISKAGGKINTSSITLVALSISINILATAVKKLSEIDTDGGVKGILALGAVFLELGIFMKIVNGSKLNVGSAIAIAGISASLLIIVKAIKDIAAIPVNDLVIGLSAIGAILLEIGLFTRIASGSRMITAATSMTIIAGALILLVDPIKELGSTDIETLATGLISMTVALGLVVAAMKLAAGGLGGATAILVMAGAVNALVPPIQALGSMSVEDLAKALITLAGAFTVIGIAAKLIGLGGSAALLAFALALGAVSLAALSIAAAFLAFGSALTVLGALTGSVIGSIITALGLLLDGLITLIPKIGTAMLEMIKMIASVLVEGVPTLVDAGLQLFLGLLKAMVDFLPEFFTLGLQLLTGIMDSLAENAPALIESGVNLMIELLNGMSTALRENSEEIVSSVMLLIESILELVIDALVAVADVLYGWIPGFSEAADGLGTAAKDALQEAFGVEDTTDIGKRGGQGFVDGLDSNSGDAYRTGEKVAENGRTGAGSVSYTETGITAGIQYATGVSGQAPNGRSAGSKLSSSTRLGAASTDFTSTGRGGGKQYTDGVSSQGRTSTSAGRGLANKAKEGASGVSLHGSGSNMGQGFADGISSKSWTVSSAASGLANLARGAVEKVLAIFSPSRVMRKDGQYTGEGLALGIADKGRDVWNAATAMAQGAIDAVKGFSENFNSTMLDNLELEPEITPVINLDNISGFDLSDTFDITGMNSTVRSVTSRMNVRSLDPIVQPYTTTSYSTDPETLRLLSRLINKVDTISDRAIIVENNMDSEAIGRGVAKPIKKIFRDMDLDRDVIRMGGPK